MRVRVKELAQEAKFIRHEETKIKNNKLYRSDYFELSPDKQKIVNDMARDCYKLNSHRRHDVREAARAAQLAYGFLRGIPYKNIEGKRKLEKEYRFKHYILPEIKRLATKFGRLGYKENYDQEVENWLNAD